MYQLIQYTIRDGEHDYDETAIVQAKTPKQAVKLVTPELNDTYDGFERDYKIEKYHTISPREAQVLLNHGVAWDFNLSRQPLKNND